VPILLREPSVKFTCSDCEGLVYEFVDVPAYDLMADSEHDAEGFDTYDVDCPHCHTRYSIDFTAQASGVRGEIPSHPNISVEVIVPYQAPYYDDEYEDYLREYVSNDPYGIYNNAVFDIRDIVKFAEKSPVSKKTFYRIIFVQYFSIIETYLSDHLSKSLFADIDALVKLVENHRDWSKEKISLSAMIKDNSAALDAIKDRLQSVMYHNFLAVDFNYLTAFGYSIFPDTKTKEELIRMAFVRHDCVHRNGRDKSNIEHDIGAEEIENLASAIDKLVNNIHEKSKRSFFISTTLMK